MPSPNVGGVNLAIDFFTYSAFFSQLASASEASQQISIQADSAFIVQALNVAVVSNNAIVTNPLVTLQIIDSGSGRNLFDDEQFIGNITGSGQRPFYMPIARQFAPNSNIQVLVRNINSANPLDIYLSFVGHKLFAYSRG